MREDAIKAFNKPDSEVFIFLLSIRAAGRGLNLQVGFWARCMPLVYELSAHTNVATASYDITGVQSDNVGVI